MPISSNFSDLADNGFGRGSVTPGVFTGSKFGTLVGEINSGDPVFPEHVLRLYRALANAQTDVEIGINGLVAAQNLRVNNTLEAFEIQLIDLTVTGDTSVERLSLGGTLTVDGGAFGDGVSAALSDITTTRGDVSTADAGQGEIRYDLRDDAVQYRKIDVDAGTDGLLLAENGSMKWTPLLVSSELSGDGISQPLGIAERSVGLSELETGADDAFFINDGDGEPSLLEIDAFSVPVRDFNEIDTVFLDTNTVLGRRTGGVSAITLEELTDDLNLHPADITTTSSSNDNVFGGSGAYRFTEAVKIFGGEPELNLVVEDPPDSETRTAEITLRRAGSSRTASIALDYSRDSAGNASSTFVFEGLGDTEVTSNPTAFNQSANTTLSAPDGSVNIESDLNINIGVAGGTANVNIEADDDVSIDARGGNILLDAGGFSDGWIFFGGTSFLSANIAIEPNDGVILLKKNNINDIDRDTGKFDDVPIGRGWGALFAYDDGGSDVNLNFYEFDRDVNNPFA